MDTMNRDRLITPSKLPCRWSSSRALLLILLLPGLAGSLVALKQAPRGGHDFAAVYAAAKTFCAGGNPYAQVAIDQTWQASGGEAETRPRAESTPSVYPPTTYLVLTPMTIGQWPAARWAWIVVNVVSISGTIVLLLRFAGSWRSQVHLLLAGALLLGALPWATNIMMGQTTPLTVFAIVASAALARADRNIASGMSLVLAILIKPQIALPFAAYYLWTRRWRLSATWVSLAILFSAAAIIHLRPYAGTWPDDWMANLRSAGAAGGINDPGPANAVRYQLVNMQVMLRTFIVDTHVVRFMTLGLTIVLVSLFAWATWRRPDDRTAGNDIALLDLACIAAIALMPIYHRAYDTWLLVFPLIWAANRLWDADARDDNRRRLAPLLTLGVILTLIYLAPLAYHVAQSPRVVARAPGLCARVGIVLENARSGGVLLTSLIVLLARLQLARQLKTPTCDVPRPDSGGPAIPISKSEAHGELAERPSKASSEDLGQRQESSRPR